jgi:uncharacterized protein YbjQ (UPF0145 family)
MSTWVFIVTATACGGALLLWTSISQAKHLSEQMLKKYEEMLAASRAERLKQLQKQAEAAKAAEAEAAAADRD